MKKICQPSPPMRKRRTGSRHQANKVEKLEEKLDGLVTLLRSATSATPGILNAISVNSTVEDLLPSSHGQSSGSPAPDSNGHGGYVFNEPLHTGRGLPDSAFTPAPSSSGSASINLPPLVHPSLEPSPEDAELYLNRFRTDFVKRLPFIVISPSVTAHQLRQESPYLWLSVMTVASTRSTQQIFLSKELAIAILYDLGLDKPPSNDPGLILEYDLKGARKPSRFSRSPTLEERRALLGCFFLSSVPSFVRKGETLRWTAYCDECLRVLEEQKEFASDELLIQLVKVRLIAEKVVDLPWSGAAEGDHFARPSATFYLKSLQAQLHNFKSSTPSELADNHTLLLELYNTELCIHEIGFSQAPGLFTDQSNQRFECLYACLQAIKSWIDSFLSILPAQYVGFSACTYAEMTRCLIGLWRLSTCEHPEWDRDLVRENLDVSLILEEAEKNFAQVKEAAGLDRGGSQDSDFFSIMASRLRSMKFQWDTLTTSTTASFSTALLDDLGDFPAEFLDAWNW
ncbi:MAG: hypothetical protein MMC33_009174 [Icmadophila ericetorum]|nr:hypothetical protein [Icmadophila ericetorum]